MSKWLKKGLITLVSCLFLIWLILRFIFGGGSEYIDLNTVALIPSDSLIEVLEFHEPVGNIAVSNSERIFFSIHPEARSNFKIMEWINNEAIPFPSESFQKDSLTNVLGIVIDRQNRLWLLDNGFHGLERPTIWAIDLQNDQVVYKHEFSKSIAPPGSYLNDLQVSEDGRFVFITDMSYIAQKPALIVHDCLDRQSRRRLEGRASVEPEDYFIETEQGKMSFLLGAIMLKPGVDGIALDHHNKKLYFSAMTNSGLYRIDQDVLTNFHLKEEAINAAEERLCDKPIADGLSVDRSGRVYITDVEHSSVLVWDEKDGLRTLIRDESKVRWADGLSFGKEDELYISDSALPDIMFKNRKHIHDAAPYYIFKVRTGFKGYSGQ